MEKGPNAVCERADELIRLFAIDGSREDLISLARACEGFADELSRRAVSEIMRRAERAAN